MNAAVKTSALLLAALTLLFLMAPPATPQETWEVAPRSYTDPSTGASTPSEFSIQDVIGANRWSSSGKNRPRLCEPGDTLQCEEGEYRHFRFTHTYDEGGEVDPTITVKGIGHETVIIPNEVGGSQTCYLEWGGGVALRSLTLLGDDTAAFYTENPWSKRWNGAHPGFRDVLLHSVDIDCGFNFETGNGPRNKWAVFGYGLGPSAYRAPGYVEENVHIRGVFHEHGHYFHNSQGGDGRSAGGASSPGSQGHGGMYFYRGSVIGAGRTAFQFTARQGEGPPGSGNVYIGDYLIEDVCMNDGGSAITIAGGHDGTFWLRNVVCKLGCNPDIHPDYADRVTGCVVAHRGGDSYPVKPRLVISGGRYVVGRENPGKGSFRRPSLNLGNLAYLRIEHAEVWSHPGTREALWIDLDSIDEVELCLSCDIRGDVAYVRNGEVHRFKDDDDGEWNGSAYRAMHRELWPPEPSKEWDDGRGAGGYGTLRDRR